MISVIIPTHNRSRLLCEAVLSCLEQSLPPSQVIVVDDASTDDTPTVFPAWLGMRGFSEILDHRDRRFSDGHVDIVFHRLPANRGAAAARNEGLRQATGDFAAFLDSDDLLTPDSLRARAEFLAANPGIGLVFGDTVHVEANGTVETASFFDRFGIRERLTLEPISGGWQVANAFDAFLRHCEMLTPQVMVRMSSIRQLEWFDERLRVAEDRECWARWAQAFPIGMVDAIVAQVRLGTSSQLTKNNEAAWDEAVAYLERKRLRTMQLTKHLRAETRCRYAKAVFDLAYLQLWQRQQAGKALAGFARSFMARPSIKSVKGCLISSLATTGLVTRLHATKRFTKR